VPKSEFKVVSGPNGDFYRINYDIEMTFEAFISFRLKFNGMFSCLSEPGPGPKRPETHI
jgi:hypothetical protein